MDCLFNVADTNNDGKITRAEVEDAENTYLWRWERWIVPVDKVMQWCDLNLDDVIDATDMKYSENQCLELENDSGDKTGKLCKLKDKFCDRAAKKLNKVVY